MMCTPVNLCRSFRLLVLLLLLFPQLSSADVTIDPRDIKPGTVNAFEFGCLDGVVSNIQVQINNITAGSPTNWAAFAAMTNIVPKAPDQYNLGSPALPFRNLYLGATRAVYFGANALTWDIISSILASTNNWTASYAWVNSMSNGVSYVFSRTNAWNQAAVDSATWTNSPAYRITVSDTNNWSTAYGWGNHTNAGYFKANGTIPATGHFNLGGFKITNAAAGTATNDFIILQQLTWGTNALNIYLTNQIVLGDLSVSNFARAWTGGVGSVGYWAMTNSAGVLSWTRIIPGAGGVETDPVFTNWVNTNVFFTTETDPVFTNWVNTSQWVNLPTFQIATNWLNTNLTAKIDTHTNANGTAVHGLGDAALSNGTAFASLGVYQTGTNQLQLELNVVSNITDGALLTNGTRAMGADLQMGTNAVVGYRFGSGAGQGAVGVDWLAVGYNAALSVTGDSWTAVGYQAGASAVGTNWIALGISAGNSARGDYWTAMGERAGNLVQGDLWTAVGYQAGDNAAGSGWTALGAGAGNYAVGDEWTAIGDQAGANVVGAYWTAIGISAGNLVQGDSWTALGEGAGDSAQGDSWTALGEGAGGSAQGDSWTALGISAGNSVQGDSWTAVGYQAGASAVGTNWVALGNYAGRAATSSNRLYLDVYQGDPGYAAGEATNDMIFGDTGYLYLGRGAGAPGGAKGGTLRGSWNVNGTNITASLTSISNAIPSTNGLVSTNGVGATGYFAMTSTAGVVSWTEIVPGADGALLTNGTRGMGADLDMGSTYGTSNGILNCEFISGRTNLVAFDSTPRVGLILCTGTNIFAYGASENFYGKDIMLLSHGVDPKARGDSPSLIWSNVYGAQLRMRGQPFRSIELSAGKPTGYLNQEWGYVSLKGYGEHGAELLVSSNVIVQTPLGSTGAVANLYIKNGYARCPNFTTSLDDCLVNWSTLSSYYNSSTSFAYSHTLSVSNFASGGISNIADTAFLTNGTRKMAGNIVFTNWWEGFALVTHGISNCSFVAGGEDFGSLYLTPGGSASDSGVIAYGYRTNFTNPTDIYQTWDYDRGSRIAAISKHAYLQAGTGGICYISIGDPGDDASLYLRTNSIRNSADTYITSGHKIFCNNVASFNDELVNWQCLTNYTRDLSLAILTNGTRSMGAALNMGTNSLNQVGWLTFSSNPPTGAAIIQIASISGEDDKGIIIRPVNADDRSRSGDIELLGVDIPGVEELAGGVILRSAIGSLVRLQYGDPTGARLDVSNGAVHVSQGNLLVSSNILAGASNVYDIGSLKVPFRSLYLGTNTIYMDGIAVLRYDSVTTQLISSVPVVEQASTSSPPVLYLTNEPAFLASVAYNITAGDTNNWSTAFSWGDHALMNYLTNGQAGIYFSGTTALSNAVVRGTQTNYGIAVFEGLVRLTNNAIAWDDMLSSANSAYQSGATDISTDDALGGKSFATSATTNAANDHLTFTFQTPHRRKSGTSLKPHIHFWQTNADQTNCWYAYYSFAAPGQTNSVEVQVGPASNELAYAGGTLHQLASFPDIDGTGKGISSILRYKLYRFGSRGTGSITVTDLDCHYQVDGFGSDTPTAKSY